MDICVCIKRLPLVGSSFVLTDDATEIDTRRLGFTLSPHEECAVEAAVQLVEEHGGSVTLLSMGTAETEEQLREQLAIGADRAILIETDGGEADPQATAAALAQAIADDGTAFDLVILGSESADVGGYQTGIRLAHRLGYPVVTNVKQLKVADGVATCERAVGPMREVYETTLPAVITVKDGLNIPRYPSVPGRIKARKKPIEHVSIELAAPRMEKIKLLVPQTEAKGATDLGTGADAARELVEVMKQIGVLT
jgi:electron transfer flavoprotein beta subunit